MTHKNMEDHITDGPQTPEDACEEWEAFFSDKYEEEYEDGSERGDETREPMEE